MRSDSEQIVGRQDAPGWAWGTDASLPRLGQRGKRTAAVPQGSELLSQCSCRKGALIKNKKIKT